MTRCFQAFVSLAVLLAACSEAAVPDAQEPPRQEETVVLDSPAEETSDMVASGSATVIVMLGDSLTAGYGLPGPAALPAVIERRLIERGLDVSLINAGVSGDTTAMGLARYDWSVASAQPDLLVIALGANDFLRGVPAGIAYGNLAQIIERAKSAGIDVVLAGLEPRFTEVPEFLQAEYAEVYPRLAEDFDVPLYSGFMRGVWNEPDLLMMDGLHPTVEGVERMADRLTDFLAAELEGEGAP